MKRKVSYVLAFAVVIALAGFLAFKKWIQEPVEQVAYVRSTENVRSYEQEHPLQFLEVEAEFRKNLFGTRYTVEGTISSKASQVAYKDFEVVVTMYAATGTLVKTEREMIFSSISPGKSEKFTFKVDRPREADSCSIRLSGALPD